MVGVYIYKLTLTVCVSHVLMPDEKNGMSFIELH